MTTTLFYFKCEKCNEYQPVDDDTPTPHSIPHLEYPEKYGDSDASIMIPVCRRCYKLFIKEWTN
jgi:hypothetical protein